MHSAQGKPKAIAIALPAESNVRLLSVIRSRRYVIDLAKPSYISWWADHFGVSVLAATAGGCSTGHGACSRQGGLSVHLVGLRLGGVITMRDAMQVATGTNYR